VLQLLKESGTCLAPHRGRLPPGLGRPHLRRCLNVL
jgi:hypothetical protein